jgi:hypothetical protein
MDRGRYNMRGAGCKMQDRRWLTGDGGRGSDEKLFSVHDDDPPFVDSSDAEVSIS